MQRVWYGSHPLRYLLLPLSLLTLATVAARRMWFRFARPTRAPMPVIVVGGLTVGGAGKTPLVVAIVRRLEGMGYRPGVVSRGYGARRRQYPHRVQSTDAADAVGDEPLLLRRRTRRPVVIDPDRCRALTHLAGHSDANVAVSDDGLQHYRLHRDIEIAVIDGKHRFGNGLLLPAGPLREPRSRLGTVDFVVVNDGDGAGERVALTGGPAKQFSMRLKPVAFENLVSGERLAPGGFEGRTVHACAGIAHPQRFFNALERLGVQVHAHAYPDHHRYRVRDIRFETGTPVVVTEKDAVKCRCFADDNIWFLQTEAVLEEAFWKIFDARLLQYTKAGSTSPAAP